MIADEIERLALLIQMLLDDGWHSVKVVTDHGWLFCPGGLPSAELPQHLTTSRRRLLVEDDELEGAAVVVVLLSPDGRVIARRRTVVGGEA